MHQSTTLLNQPSGELVIPSLPSENASLKSQHCEKLILSLVIPTFNERENIEELVTRLSLVLDSFIKEKYELIIVDDDSPDKTWQHALDLKHKFPFLEVMRRVGEKGLASAVIRGWQVSKGSILGVIDADLQHPPEIIKELVAKIHSGSDLAVGSRHTDGGGVSEWSLLRRFLSRGAQVLGLLISPNVVGRISDPMSGYFVFRRDSIADIQLNPKGYKILLEIVGRGKIDDISEVGYIFQERIAGSSKVTWKQYVDYIHHLLRLRSRGRIGRIKRYFPLKSFLRFSIVGLSGVFVDMTLLYLLHTGLDLPLTRSKIFSAEVAIINNFIWNDMWTFASVSQRQKGWSLRTKRFLKFNLICLSGLILNVLILNVLYNFVFSQRWAYLANLIAIGLVTAWNFWMNLKLSWRVTQVK